MRTDVHTFAFSVAANSILSFFPFVVLMMTLIRRVFHSRVMYDVVVELLRDYLPAGQDFVIRNLTSMVNSRQRVQFVSRPQGASVWQVLGSAATGVKFAPVTSEALAHGLRTANLLFNDKVTWRRLQLSGLATDVSWRNRAGDYAALYRGLMTARA